MIEPYLENQYPQQKNGEEIPLLSQSQIRRCNQPPQHNDSQNSQSVSTIGFLQKINAEHKPVAILTAVKKEATKNASEICRFM